MATGKEILEDMGLDYEEAVAFEQDLKKLKQRDRRVCACGHAMARHEFNPSIGLDKCSALRYDCKCRKPNAVLDTNDVRPFRFRTEGSGIQHAISRGIVAAVKKGHELNWIEEAQICDKCKTTEGKMTPMTVTSNGFPADHDTGFNVLFCTECRIGK